MLKSRNTILPICATVCALLAAVTPIAFADEAAFPQPSPYPISWEFDFTHSVPKRIVVDTGTSAAPLAFWYMTYTVTNNTDKEQLFLPNFEMLADNAQLSRSDQNIPLRVFQAIKNREHNSALEPMTSIAGEVRIGQAEARDGVAIWPEPLTRMGHFSIFVTGLSGEAVTLKMVDGQYNKVEPGQEKETKDLLVLRKTLRLNYFVRGGDVFPGESDVLPQGQEWIMR